jgi:hypothetical protein
MSTVGDDLRMLTDVLATDRVLLALMPRSVL